MSAAPFSTLRTARARRSRRPSVRSAVLVVGLAGAVALGGCNRSSSDSKVSAAGGADGQQAAGGAPSSTAPPPAPGGTAKPGPTKPKNPNCATVYAFQTLNYTATTIETTKKSAKNKDTVLKELGDAGVNAAKAVPDLVGPIRVVTGHHRAAFEGKPDPAPVAGDPNLADANKQLFAWQKANC